MILNPWSSLLYNANPWLDWLFLTNWLWKYENSVLNLIFPVWNRSQMYQIPFCHWRVWQVGNWVFYKNLCLDSAHDNIPMHKLLDHLDINALIDINKRGAAPPTDFLMISLWIKRLIHCTGLATACTTEDMTKTRMYKKPLPPCMRQGRYGRTIYIRNGSDLWFHLRLSRDSNQYKTIYCNRSASERVNNRVLNDYHLQDLKICGNDHFSFWMMIIGIFINLDTWYKMNNRAGHTLWAVLFWRRFEYKFDSVDLFQTTRIVSPF